MSDSSAGVPIWTCHFADPTSGSDKLDNLTVGTKFAMACQGEIAVDWDQSPTTVKFNKDEEAFSLVILKTEKLEAKGALFEVTGYKPGDHHPEYFRVLQGEHGFEVAKPTWSIKSVLNPKDKPQPFGPFGPFQVTVPPWVLVLTFIFIFALIMGLVRAIRNRLKRRRVLEQLKRHRTALPPAHQFYRDARLLRRRLYAAVESEELKSILKDLDRDFRLFLLRQFEIAAIDGTESDLLKALRRHPRVAWGEVESDLTRTLRELGRLVEQPVVHSSDVEQLHRMSVRTAEKLEQTEVRA